MKAPLHNMLLVIAFLLFALATAAPASAAGLAAHTLTVDGLSRSYAVYAPASYTGREPVPVVIMLHGAGATGPGVIGETGWDKKSEQHGFLAVFPDAMRVDPAAPPSYLANPQLWNDGSGRGQSFLDGVNDVKFLDLLVGDLAKKYSVDTKAVFLTGFSNGASLAFRAAATLPTRFAAIAPVAGPYWPPAKPDRGKAVPTLFIIGTADPLNPLTGGTITLPWGTFAQPPVLDRLQQWAAHSGCSNGLQPAPGRPGIRELACSAAGATPLKALLVEDLGHLWPGGEPLFPEAYIGKDPGTLAATDEIWAFFAAVRAQNR